MVDMCSRDKNSVFDVMIDSWMMSRGMGTRETMEVAPVEE